MRVMHERRGIPAAFVCKFKGDAWRTLLRVLLLQPLVLCLQEQQPQPDLSAITDFFSPAALCLGTGPFKPGARAKTNGRRLLNSPAFAVAPPGES
jgi:hypothetical protein